MNDQLLSGSVATLCRCWLLTRRDGIAMGFADHDGSLFFEGQSFRPTEAVDAQALARSTGLSVDNSEILGGLSDAGLAEEDILSGRFDGAEIRVWEVDWSDPGRRSLLFAGHLGEIERMDGAFRAELRGLAEALNRPMGRIYQRQCGAVLGDGACGVDLTQSGWRVETVVRHVSGDVLETDPVQEAETDWFRHGQMEVLSGRAQGLSESIKADRSDSDQRSVTLWAAVPGLRSGDRIALVAGCDRSARTCREKFGNLLNFRGCPHLPDEDWLLSHPGQEGGR
ncbi:DUF2163 domain-containing protein [Palleronia caenipelagi]|uniref:DUF2163 domain-containing protein n=1 Tax=Palleronia caenipelagi TaxID=2489174 RepID=A0A547Q0G1_9RHOB|nr:DUF2163 domain-containing protein [Palleronia caenipelagi]TRD19768.1 DUF2163 domain-containing protein [Palleronia caenipelagi]